LCKGPFILVFIKIHTKKPLNLAAKDLRLNKNFPGIFLPFCSKNLPVAFCLPKNSTVKSA